MTGPQTQLHSLQRHVLHDDGRVGTQHVEPVVVGEKGIRHLHGDEHEQRRVVQRVSAVPARVAAEGLFDLGEQGLVRNDGKMLGVESGAGYRGAVGRGEEPVQLIVGDGFAGVGSYGSAVDDGFEYVHVYTSLADRGKVLLSKIPP